MTPSKTLKVITLVGLLVLMVIVWMRMPRDVSAEDLVHVIRGHGIISPLIAFGMAFVQAAIPIFPFFILSSANGLIFGPFAGIMLTWMGALAGATLSFGLARYLGEEWVLKFIHPKYLKWQQGLNGQTILIARLIPIIPSTGINLVAGLSKVSLITFVSASAVGKLPFVIIYTFLGYNLSRGNAVNNLILIFVLLALATYLFSMRLSRLK